MRTMRMSVTLLHALGYAIVLSTFDITPLYLCMRSPRSSRTSVTVLLRPCEVTDNMLAGEHTCSASGNELSGPELDRK